MVTRLNHIKDTPIITMLPCLNLSGTSTFPSLNIMYSAKFRSRCWRQSWDSPHAQHAHTESWVQQTLIKLNKLWYRPAHRTRRDKFMFHQQSTISCVLSENHPGKQKCINFTNFQKVLHATHIWRVLRCFNDHQYVIPAFSNSSHVMHKECWYNTKNLPIST